MSTDPTLDHDPTMPSRAEVTAAAHDEILDARAGLLRVVHDIDRHHYGDGESLYWLDGQSPAGVAAQTLDLVEQLQAAARKTADAVTAAAARAQWLTSGGPLWCGGCDNAIELDLHDWQVCRGWAEHTYCHRDTRREDTSRAITVKDNQRAANLEERTRTERVAGHRQLPPTLEGSAR